MPSIISGKFVIKDHCLMWQVAKDNYMTPLFPSNEVVYLKAEKTVVLKGINVKLGGTISTAGHITPTSSLEFVTQGDGACLTELGMAIDAHIM